MTSNIFHNRFSDSFDAIADSLDVFRGGLRLDPVEELEECDVGAEASARLRVALDLFVLNVDVVAFRHYVGEAHERAIQKLVIDDRKAGSRQHVSSLVSFRYLAFSLAAGNFADAREIALALNHGIERRLGGHGWVDAVAQFFIYLTLRDFARVRAVATHVKELDPSIASSATAYAALALAITSRDSVKAAHGVELVLAAHPLDCGEGGHFEFWKSGQIVCVYGLAMVNAAAMHGFRVPLNGDVQIPEELVVVPPESV